MGLPRVTIKNSKPTHHPGRMLLMLALLDCWLASQFRPRNVGSRILPFVASHVHFLFSRNSNLLRFIGSLLLCVPVGSSVNHPGHRGAPGIFVPAKATPRDSLSRSTQKIEYSPPPVGRNSPRPSRRVWRPYRHYRRIESCCGARVVTVAAPSFPIILAAVVRKPTAVVVRRAGARMAAV